MSQSPTEPVEAVKQQAAAETRPFRVSAREGWRYAVREFVIIMAGVLAALGAQAWWESHQEREREQSYIAQLLSETRENEAQLLDGIAIDSAGRVGARSIIDALTTTGPVTADSFFTWMSAAGSASDFQAVAGTFQALIRSGDLRVIRDDSLRVMVTRYTADIDRETQRLLQLRGTILDAVAGMGRELPFMRRVFLDGPDVDAFDIAQLRANKDAVGVVFVLHAANENRLNNLERLLRETRDMLRALERASGIDTPATSN